MGLLANKKLFVIGHNQPQVRAMISVHLVEHAIDYDRELNYQWQPKTYWRQLSSDQ